MKQPSLGKQVIAMWKTKRWNTWDISKAVGLRESVVVSIIHRDREKRLARESA